MSSNLPPDPVNINKLIVVEQLLAYQINGDDWHGYLYTKNGELGLMWAHEDPELAKIAHDDLGWDYEDLSGEWVIKEWHSHDGEKIYGPRAGAEDQSSFEGLALGLLLARYQELSGQALKSTNQDLGPLTWDELLKSHVKIKE